MSNGHIPTVDPIRAALIAQQEARQQTVTRQMLLDSIYRGAFTAAFSALIVRAHGDVETGAIDYEACAVDAEKAALVALPRLLKSIQLHQGPPPPEMADGR